MTSTTLPTAMCSDGNSVYGTLTVPTMMPVIAASSTSISVVEAFTIWAPLIQLNWKSTDRTSASGTSASAQTSSYSSSLSSSSKSGASGTSTPAASSTSTSAPGQVSSGAIAGIVIGCVVAVLFLAVGFFFLRRRARPRAPASGYHGQQDAAGTGPFCLTDDKQTGLNLLDGRPVPVSELEGGGRGAFYDNSHLLSAASRGRAPAELA